MTLLIVLFIHQNITKNHFQPNINSKMLLTTRFLHVLKNLKTSRNMKHCFFLCLSSPGQLELVLEIISTCSKNLGNRSWNLNSMNQLIFSTLQPPSLLTDTRAPASCYLIVSLQWSVAISNRRASSMPAVKWSTFRLEKLLIYLW